MVEIGKAHRLHDFCCFSGYGAEAINTYLVLDTLQVYYYTNALRKIILKEMSKIDISPIRSITAPSATV